MNLHGKYLTTVNLSLCLLVAGTITACGGGDDDNLMTTPLSLNASSLNRTSAASAMVASATTDASDSGALVAPSAAKESIIESDPANAKEQLSPNAQEDPLSSQSDLSTLPPTSAGALSMGKPVATRPATSILALNSVATSNLVVPVWTKIAAEHESFELTKAQTVRYGAGTTWVQKSVIGKAQCSNTYFGKDPIYGTLKSCDVQEAVTSPTPVPLPVLTAPVVVSPPVMTPVPRVAACSTTPVVTTSSSTKLSVAVGRSSGVAPLSVFFDATGTVSSATARPFHDIEYRWNFGETSGPGIGKWNQGSRPGKNSRNTAIGPVAGHVFETPGTYIVTVNDAAKTVNYECRITVQDPEVVFAGSNTTCFSTSGIFADCPVGANRVQTSDFAVVRNAATAENKVRRLLMRRGETWTATDVVAFNATGPGMLGAFGSGAAPVIAPAPGFPDSTALIGLSSRTTPNMKDWRFMDIKLDASSKRTGKITGFEAFGGFDQLTLLRVTTDVVMLPIEMSEYILDYYNASLNPSMRGHHEWDQLAIIDLNVLNMPPVQDGKGAPLGVYLGAERLFFAGNSIDGHGTEVQSVSHNARFTYLAKASVSNNTFMNPGPTQHCIKLHSKEWGDTGVAGTQGIGAGYTRWVHIADNKCVPAYGAWPITIGYPSNDPMEFRGKDIILERNLQTASLGRGGQFQSLWWPDITSRNNIFDMSSWETEKLGIYIGKRGSAHTPPDRVHVYNNTFYSSKAADVFTAVQVDDTATNVVIKNNLAYSPNDRSIKMILGTGALTSPLISSNNTSDLRKNPMFLTLAPEIGEFKLTTGSYAVGAAITVPVFSDFLGEVKVPSTASDLGSSGH